jgi:hypothetical protein
MDDSNEQVGTPTLTAMPGAERPAVPAESSPLSDLAAFASSRSRQAKEKERQASQTLRTTGLDRREAGWAWSVIKKRMEGGEVFDGFNSFRDWAGTKSGYSMKTVYRWVKVAEDVPRQEAVGRTPTELLVRTGQIDSPEVQQVKKYAEEAARKVHELNQGKQEEEEAEQDEGQEEDEEKKDESEQANRKPKPKPRPRPRPKGGNGQGKDPGHLNDDDPTSHPSPSRNSNGEEANQLEKLRQAKALIESIHFPTASVREAARALIEQIGSSLLGSKKPIPSGKWQVRVLGYMDNPDKAAGAKALADSVVGGTVSTVFRIGLRPVQIIDLEIDASANVKLASTRQGNGTAKTSVDANNNIEVEFGEENEHTTWLEILEMAHKDGPTYPFKVKLPRTSEQKRSLREQLEEDLESYQPPTL